MTNLQKFIYNGSQITFETENGSVLVNATEMAKPFDKLPADFIRLKSTQEFIEALCNRYGISHNEVVKVIQGGAIQGTWFHQKLGLRYAQWLSPDFAVWVDEKIEELLTTGKATIHQLSNKELALMVIQEAEEKERALAQLELANETIEKQAPKVEYTNTVLLSGSTLNATQIAKELGMSGEKFNKKLHDLGIQYKSGDMWVLYAKYQNLGYTGTETYPYKREDGTTGTRLRTKWTEKGRAFIHEMLNDKLKKAS